MDQGDAQLYRIRPGDCSPSRPLPTAITATKPGCLEPGFSLSCGKCPGRTFRGKQFRQGFPRKRGAGHFAPARTCSPGNTNYGRSCCGRRRRPLTSTLEALRLALRGLQFWSGLTPRPLPGCWRADRNDTAARTSLRMGREAKDRVPAGRPEESSRWSGADAAFGF